MRKQRLEARLLRRLGEGHPIEIVVDRAKLDWRLKGNPSLTPKEFQRIRNEAHGAVEEDPFSHTQTIPVPMVEAPLEDHLEELERVTGEAGLRLSEIDGERFLTLRDEITDSELRTAQKRAEGVSDPIPPSRARAKQRIYYLGTQAAPMLAARSLGSSMFQSELAEIAAEIARLEAL